MTKEKLNEAAQNLRIIDKYLSGPCSQTIHAKPDFQSEVKHKEDVNYWPNTDPSVWMRSCEEEVIEPLQGTTSGQIPTWIRGTLLRNGPGSLKVGNYRFDHLFDSSALLHRFHISDGKVTYQRRFIQTDVFKRNHQAKRIVLTEFGTKGIPDPCQSIFQRVAAIFDPVNNMTDNSMISVYPLGDEFYTFTEIPVIHRINPETLETTSKVNISKSVGIVNHTAHPHIAEDGRIYNVGLTITLTGPAYVVVEFSPNENGCKTDQSMFERASIVARTPARWTFNPSYMHSFGITKNHFIIVEQPLAIAFTTLAACRVANKPLCTSLKWHDKENTLIHVISRKSGKLVKTFVAESFFFLHIINQFETADGEHIVLDICCYRDAKMLDCMYVDVMKNMHKNPDYSKLFRGRPLRFILPMTPTPSNLSAEENLIHVTKVHSDVSVDSILCRKASAHRLPDGSVFVRPELICDLGCETPRLNQEHYVGVEYRYFYAISSDVDLKNPGTIIKVDTVTKTRITWSEENLYPSEPIFVPRPGAKDEDDGVILSAVVFGKTISENMVCLLVLDAKNLEEIGRTTFSTPGPVPKCLHGWFARDKHSEMMECKNS